jgi:malonyl-CoA/methylmalonyl-CoA synthetase
MILGNPLTPASARFPGYVGRAFPGVDVKLSEEGEVLVRSPEGLFSRYHNQTEATRQAFDDDHWYKTGDMGVYDQEKGYKIIGRLSCDIIKCGGYKLSALEIEAAIMEHSRVAEVSVVGRPHPHFGEEVVAIVRLKEDSTSSENKELTMEDLSLASRLATYKLPRLLLVVKSIPKNAMGKVNKKTLLNELDKM